MNKINAGIIIACSIVLLGWGSAYGSGFEHEQGHAYADEKYHKDAEDIKRTQSGESGGRDLHSYFVVNM